MRFFPLGPLVELPTGHGTPCWVGETHAKFSTGVFGGAPYGATKRCTRRGYACGRSHWGPRWSSLRSHEALYCVGWTHADGSTGTFGGDAWGRRMRT
eukprot:8221665-Pyramimonas_sp.AAC.1